MIKDTKFGGPARIYGSLLVKSMWGRLAEKLSSKEVSQSREFWYSGTILDGPWEGHLRRDVLGYQMNVLL